MEFPSFYLFGILSGFLRIFVILYISICTQSSLNHPYFNLALSYLAYALLVFTWHVSSAPIF